MNFATLGRSRYRRRLPRIRFQAILNNITYPFTHLAPGRRQILYLVNIYAAKSCVFNKQSLSPIQCHQYRRKPTTDPLYPEVTESFCRVPSIFLIRYLSILYQLTINGFRYGYYIYHIAIIA